MCVGEDRIHLDSTINNFLENRQLRTFNILLIHLLTNSRCIRPLASSAGKVETFSTSSIHGHFAIWYDDLFGEIWLLICFRDVNKNLEKKIKTTMSLEGRWHPMTHYLLPEMKKKAIKWYVG